MKKVILGIIISSCLAGIVGFGLQYPTNEVAGHETINHSIQGSYF
jgi:hypothetical protein